MREFLETAGNVGSGRWSRNISEEQQSPFEV